MYQYICYTYYRKLPLLQKKTVKFAIKQKKNSPIIRNLHSYSKFADFAANFVNSAELSEHANRFFKIEE